MPSTMVAEFGATGSTGAPPPPAAPAAAGAVSAVAASAPTAAPPVALAHTPVVIARVIVSFLRDRAEPGSHVPSVADIVKVMTIFQDSVAAIDAPAPPISSLVDFVVAVLRDVAAEPAV